MPPAPRTTDNAIARRGPRARELWLALGVVLAFALSVVVRLEQLGKLDNAIAIDAPYHVLLTIAAYRETPITVHHGLPIVTLGARLDKSIPWGGALPDTAGNYYYASFPPLGFVIPWLVFSALSLSETLWNLTLFNIGLHGLATVTSAALGWRLAALGGASREGRSCVAGLCALAYIWNTEALYAHGLVYWGHSPFQIVWMLQLICLSFILDDRPIDRSQGGFLRLPLLGLLAFLGPSTEWTGYIANLGVLLALVWVGRSTGWRRVGPAIAVVTIASVLALAAFAGWILSTLDFADVSEVLTERFRMRSSRPAEWSRAMLLAYLVLGYIESHGLYLALALALIVAALRQARKGTTQPAVAGPSPLVWIGLAAFPLLENVLLVQHAAQYTFDRLKFTVLIVVCVAVVFPRFARGGRAAIAGAVVCCAVFTLAQLLVASSLLSDVSIARPRSLKDGVLFVYRRVWHAPGVSNSARLARELAGYEEAIYAVPGGVRGHACLLLRRNAYADTSSVAMLDELIAARQSRYGIWILGGVERNNVCTWNLGVVRDAAGHTVEIVGLMSEAEAAAGIVNVATEGFAWFEQAANIEVDGETISIARCDAESQQVILARTPRPRDGPRLYRLAPSESIR